MLANELTLLHVEAPPAGEAALRENHAFCAVRRNFLRAIVKDLFFRSGADASGSAASGVSYRSRSFAKTHSLSRQSLSLRGGSQGGTANSDRATRWLEHGRGRMAAVWQGDEGHPPAGGFQGEAQGHPVYVRLAEARIEDLKRGADAERQAVLQQRQEEERIKQAAAEARDKEAERQRVALLQKQEDDKKAKAPAWRELGCAPAGSWGDD